MASQIKSLFSVFILFFAYQVAASEQIPTNKNAESILIETTEAIKLCPKGFSINTAGDKCEKLFKTEAISEQVLNCPAGFTLNNGACAKLEIEDASPLYSCHEGWVLDGINCKQMDTLLADKTTTYSCDAGYALNGSKCSRVLVTPAQEFDNCGTGWTRTSNACTRTVIQAASERTEYSCAAGYALSGTVCKRSLWKDAQINYACGSSWQLSGSTCKRTLSRSATENVSYSCSTGWSLSGTTCSKTEVKAANKSYYCKTGWEMVGSVCRPIKSASRKTNYSCPSGYSLSGSKCTKPQSIAATRGADIVSCPTNSSLNASTGKCRLWESIRSYSKPRNKTCYPAGEGTRIPVWDCYSDVAPSIQKTYSCSAGWSLSGSHCYRTITQSASISYSYYCPPTYSGGDPELWSLSGRTCTNMSVSTARSYSYSCSSGYSLSGSQCLKPLSLAATKHTSYSCPSGYSKSGNSCLKAETVSATKSYSCSAGWWLDEKTCHKNEEVSANSTLIYSCPTGYTKSSNKCSKEESKTLVLTYECASGDVVNELNGTCEKTVLKTANSNVKYSCSKAGYVLGGTYCRYEAIKSAEVTYQCEQNWTLAGTQCNLESTVAATPSTVYSCPNGGEVNGAWCDNKLFAEIDYSCKLEWKFDSVNKNCTRSVLNSSLTPWYEHRSAEISDSTPSGGQPSFSVDISSSIIAGKSGVSGGQASYTIPIDLPPGRNGIQPKVALNYNSQSGNGVAGVGWSLGTGSAISRCGATYAQDGFKSSVAFDANDDRLCLNGQRLIASGSYGASGTEYRTEMDSFVKVAQSGGINGGSTSFTVYRPDGSTATYGANANSRFTPSGLDKTLTWKITQESWAEGSNTIDYEYDTSVVGEHLLSKIYYTGTNGAQGDRYVDFVYDANHDERISFIAGGKIRQTRKLMRVDTYLNSSHQVSRYKLSHTRASASKRNLLDSVQKCAYANGFEQCGLPTTFNWLLAVDAVAQEKLAYSSLFNNVTMIKDIMPKGDVDGNGVADFPEVLLNAEGEEVGSHSKYYDDCQVNRYIGIETCIAFDADMDGITDSHRIVNGQLNISLSASGDYNTNISLGSGFKYNQDSVVYSGDLNGNGYPDLVLYHYDNAKPKLYRYLHSGNVSSPYSNNGIEIFSFGIINNGQSDWAKSIYREANFIGDVDGNGFADLLVTKTTAVGFNGVHVSIPGGYPQGFLLGQGDGSFTYKEFEGGEPPTLQSANIFNMFIDVNGDGLNDWLGWKSTEHVYSSTPNLYVRLNNGLAEFGEPINLGNELIGTRSYIAMVDPSGEEIRYRVPLFNGALKVSDKNTNGVAELLLPGERIVEGCSEVVAIDRQNKTFKKVDKCGDELYGDYYPSYNFYPEERAQPTQLIAADEKDDSIYKFDAIEFTVNGGTITASRESTSFIGSASQSSMVDIFGDGLQDMLFVYAPRVGNWIKSGQSLPSWLNGYGTYLSRSQSSTEEPYQANDYLASATDGLGNITQWSYRPLSSGVQSAGEQKVYDVAHSYIDGQYINFASSMYVVQSFEQSNGIGGTNETEYAYKGAMYNLQGRGFTGFREIIEKDVARNKTTQTVFKQKFPQVGLLESQTVKVDGTTVATTTQAWADNPQHRIAGVYHNINTNTLTHSYGLGGASEQRSSVEQTVGLADVDEHGNIGKRTKTVTDYVDGGANRYQSVIETDFTADLDNWFLRKFDSKKTTTNVTARGWENDPYLATDTEQWQLLTVNAWHSAHHQPTNVSYTASGSSCNRVEATTLNEYGLPTEARVTGQSSSCGALTARTTSFTYTKDGTSQADDGYLPYQVTNAKNHLTTTEYDMGLGVPTKVTAPNSIITETEYDAIGRPVQLSQTGSPIKYMRYLLAASGSHAPSHAHLLTRSTSAGMPTQEVYLDSLGRSLRSATQAFNGSNYQYLDKRYDSLGHLTHESLPYYSGDTAEFTVFSDFDAFDRPTARSLPNGESGGLISTYDYSGLKTDITVGGRTMSRTYGMQGLLYETVDAVDGSNRFAYDGAGRPLVIQDANDQQIVASYNGFGHKTQVVDPNQGTTIFGYNSLGELDRQTDANGVVQTFALDTLGRITTKAIKGSNANGSASYTWDTLKQGMLSSESQNGITRSYTYTNALQLATSSVQVAGSAGGDNVTRTIIHQYDGFYGRPKGLTYPNGLTLEYRYNNSGYLNQTRNAASGYVYRTVTDMDAAGHVTGSQMANTLLEQTSHYNSEGTMASTQVSSNLGVLHSHYYDHYDSFMNLTDERNAVTGLEKHYEYDNLNRLEQYSFSNAGFPLYDSVTPFAATVDYGYDAVGNLLKKTDYSRNTANAYEYNSSCVSNSNAGPNGVCAITKLNGTKIQFRYDRRGNLISGDGLTMTYNALDKPLSIVGRGPGNNTNTGFVYGSDNMRALQTRTVSGTTTKTHYVDKLFESDNDGSWRAYIGDIAVLSYTPERSHQLLYTLRDRLGSATTMVDHQGNIITQRYFDPFGRTASASVAGSLGDLVDTNRNRRGFTDHEHLNEQQLIHMNGRVYDYNMGRFMSVDPLIQSPTSTQSVNPYSYIMNNPLSGTDPTGYAGCAASRIKSKCDTTVSQYGGNGKADGKFFGGSSKSSGTVKSNGGNSYTASIQLNKNTTLEVDFKVNDIGGKKKIVEGGTGYDYFNSEADESGLLFNNGGEGFGGHTPHMSNPAMAKAVQDGSGDAAFTGAVLLTGGTLGLYIKGAESLTAFALIPASGGDPAELALVRLPAASKGWKKGDDVYKLTSKGNLPSWTTVRTRFWKNESVKQGSADKYGAENLERMARGRAPQRYNADKGGIESMELSHEPIPYRDGGTNFVPRWPQEHAAVDPFRRPGY